MIECGGGTSLLPYRAAYPVFRVRWTSRCELRGMECHTHLGQRNIACPRLPGKGNERKWVLETNLGQTEWTVTGPSGVSTVGEPMFAIVRMWRTGEEEASRLRLLDLLAEGFSAARLVDRPSEASNLYP